MNSSTFVLYFSILLSCFFYSTTAIGVESCYFCNGNCTKPELVDCSQPESGCIAYKVQQSNGTDIFKNCFAATTWNCERVKKWISNKHLHVNVVDCHVCTENGCNEDIYTSRNSSSGKTSSYIIINFLLLPLIIQKCSFS